MKAPTKPSRAGFTLIELLVVVAIIALLAALLLPALTSAKEKGKKTVCLSNLRHIGVSVISYAADNDGRIPFGSKAPPFTSPSDFYPSTGAPTSLISLRSGAPVGLGLMLQQHLCNQPKVLFCPGSDQPLDADVELAKVGFNQAQSSYYYRHAGNTQPFDMPNTLLSAEHIKLDRLGDNRNGVAIRALVMDSQFLCPPDLEEFNVKPRTHHQQKLANTLFWDGHVASRQNRDGKYTVNLSDAGALRNAFDLILKALEQADAEM